MFSQLLPFQTVNIPMTSDFQFAYFERKDSLLLRDWLLNEQRELTLDSLEKQTIYGSACSLELQQINQIDKIEQGTKMSDVIKVI